MRLLRVGELEPLRRGRTRSGDRIIHVRLDFYRAQCAVIYPDFVNQSAEERAPGNVRPDVQGACRGLDCTCLRARCHLHPVYVETQRGAIICPSNV